jgi:2-polyprenyl-6-methoxyphenol hydroxylase-like FAD-dependent oxidoreductase
VEIALIGAGPTGLFLAIGLANRGHRVTVVDRDPGPRDAETWVRRGVMQFDHAHAIRAQVVHALQAECPAAYERLLQAGAEPATAIPGVPESLMGLRCRRSTFEKGVRETAEETRGVTLRVGHVDAVAEAEGRAAGLVVDGSPLPADLVIDASGRSGRVTRQLRAEPVAGGTCGIAYVDRQYQLHPDAEPGPMVNPLAWQADLDGYQVILFLHEHGIFSVLIVRPTDARDLVDLRHDAVFEAACAAIPGLDTWTDPGRSRSITSVLPGGELKNYYRSQRGPDGGLAMPGLLFVGDSVCTTTPVFGRGIATSLTQAREVLALLDAHGSDVDAAIEAFDAWSEVNMLPWVEDHVRMDDATQRRWAGEDIALDERLPSDLILAAAAQQPAIGPAIGPYASMQALPSCLDEVEPLARAVYATGWRPPTAPGPSRGELAELVDRMGVP